MGNLHIVDHPILKHKLSVIRKKDTSSFFFRKILSEISSMLAYEATKDLQLGDVNIETPMEKCEAPMVSEEIIVASILRAGQGMLEGFLDVVPFARVAHIGIYRDKALHNTIEYYFRLPDACEGKKLFLLDPLLATGDTALAALDRLKEYRVGPISFVSVLAAPVGIEKIREAHPDVDIYTLCVERELNDKGYLLPGLGDAGDRLYHTND
ncbi:uracil phosphoribosyltransferase [bacterium]|nr:uracil phosphoribosyltransferase [bacterium]